MKKGSLLSLMLLFALWAKGQQLEAGFYGGVSFYEGDLAPNAWSLYWQTLHPAYGLVGKVHFNRHLALRMSLKQMAISGDDAISGRQRGIQVRTDLTELALLGELSLFRLYPFGRKAYVQPYLYGGMAFFRFTPRSLNQGQWVDLQPLGTEGQGLPGYLEKYDQSQTAIPAGGGVKLVLNQRWVIGAEAGIRKTFTDYLDDVGSQLVLYQDVFQGNGALAASLSRPDMDPANDSTPLPYRRGGPANDWYFTAGITVTHILASPHRSGNRRNKAQKGCYTF